jgi:hypothetical protein
VKPHIFAAGDLTYCEKYGAALKASAQEYGLECEIRCNGVVANGEKDRRYANAFRYQLLPEVLKEHPSVLMLDLDCVVRGPVEVDPGWSIGFVVRNDMDDWFKKVNGGCLYITRDRMDVADSLCKTMTDYPIWYMDQIALYKIYSRIKDEPGVKVFGHEFFSWRFDSRAAVWTGKGNIKHLPIFKEAIRPYEHISLDWV